MPSYIDPTIKGYSCYLQEEYFNIIKIGYVKYMAWPTSNPRIKGMSYNNIINAIKYSVGHK